MYILNYYIRRNINIFDAPKRTFNVKRGKLGVFKFWGRIIRRV